MPGLLKNELYKQDASWYSALCGKAYGVSEAKVVRIK